MTTREELIAARRLIADPQDWIQRAFKINRRRCAAEAIFDVARASGACRSGENSAYASLAAQIPGGVLSVFNDSHSHAEVLALFDRAIEAAA